MYYVILEDTQEPHMLLQLPLVLLKITTNSKLPSSKLIKQEF